MALEVAGMHLEPRMPTVSCRNDSAVANRVSRYGAAVIFNRRGPDVVVLSPRPYSDPLPNAPFALAVASSL
jgi:hypothetical protein